MPAGDALRLFLALPLPEPALARLVEWQRAALSGARALRVVPPDNLHVTLAFLGRRPVEDVDRIVVAMREQARASGPLVLTAARYRETPRVGMVVLADEGGRATHLANGLGDRLERLGVYEREPRPWLPHVTVARFRERPRLSPPPPDLGTVNPSEVALYHSILRRDGAQYQVVQSVALGG